jgi:hypothetical protein
MRRDDHENAPRRPHAVSPAVAGPCIFCPQSRVSMHAVLRQNKTPRTVAQVGDFERVPC